MKVLFINYGVNSNLLDTWTNFVNDRKYIYNVYIDIYLQITYLTEFSFQS